MKTTPFPDLFTLQTLMSELIRAPEGVAKGAEKLVTTGDLTSHDLSFMLDPSNRMTEIDRLDIYANMYFYRLHDCLAEDYSRTLTRIGAGHFNNLVTDYLLAHPPSHFSLREVGRAFPDFLAEHDLADRFPAVEDMARLEWARIDVFDEADAAPLDREALVLASSEDPESIFIRAIPSIRMLQLDRAVLDGWDTPLKMGSSDTSTSTPSLQPVVVWRKRFAVHHRPALPDEVHCLEALISRGLSLADLGELLLAHDRSAEESAELFARLLELWLSNGLLTRRDA